MFITHSGFCMTQHSLLNAHLEATAAAITNVQVMEFAQRASTEVSTHDEAVLPSLVGRLKPGTAVYVAHTPKAKLDDVVRVALKVQSLGFRASPHIVARRIESANRLRSALRQVRDAGIDQILMIAGDREQPAGEFHSTVEVIDSGVTLDAGIENIGVAGHPEGHPAIETQRLFDALKHKQAFADRTGSNLHIVTQFGFNPDALCTWVAGLREMGVRLPVHVGIAGPTPIAKLLKFAVQCGVGAALGSMMKNMSALTNLARHTMGPDEMMAGVLRGSLQSDGLNIVQPHLYAFGGVVATAEWLRSVVDGQFDLQPDNDKFRMWG